jgi:hypothetical protein
MIWRTRFSSLAVSTRPQNETVCSKCSALPQWRHDLEAARSRVEHLGAKVQRNLTRRLYGANGQSPEPLRGRERTKTEGGSIRGVVGAARRASCEHTSGMARKGRSFCESPVTRWWGCGICERPACLRGNAAEALCSISNTVVWERPETTNRSRAVSMTSPEARSGIRSAIAFVSRVRKEPLKRAPPIPRLPSE